MKSPLTGKPMTQIRSLKKIKGVRFMYVCYFCRDMRERFTTTELDEANMSRYEEQKKKQQK